MKRFNTISNLPGSMSIIDYEDPPFKSDKPSVVDKKYFIPLSQQSSGVFRQLDPNAYTLKDGVDDGRDISLRRRGLDLAQRSTNLREQSEKLAEQSAEMNRRAEEYKALHSKKSEDEDKDKA